MDATEPVKADEERTRLSTLIDGPKAARRKSGSARGKIRMSPDFDELPEGVAMAFRGERP